MCEVLTGTSSKMGPTPSLQLVGTHSAQSPLGESLTLVALTNLSSADIEQFAILGFMYMHPLL